MNKNTILQDRAIPIADVFLVYTMLSPIIFLIIGEHVKLVPNFFRTFIILLGPGLVAGAIYFRAFGIQSLKRSKWIIFCMIAFVLVIFLSSIKTIDTSLTKESLRFFISYCLFGFALGIMSNITAARSKRFNSIWIVFIVGFLIYTIYEHWPIINQRIFNSNKSINNAQIGSLFYFFALCGLFQLQLSMKLKARITALFIISACLIIGFYAGNRTALFGFLISVVMYLFFYSHRRLRKIYPIIFICSLILVFFILLPNIKQSIKLRYAATFNEAKNAVRYLTSKDSAFDSSNVRLRIWSDALNKYKKNPIFGVGFGTSYRDKSNDRIYVHPHNIILEILTETGILGLIIFLLLFSLILAKIYAVYQHLSATDRIPYLLFPFSLLFFFAYSSLHSDLSTEYFKWYFAGMLTGFDAKSNGVG
jgi:O-antigen ligase